MRTMTSRRHYPFLLLILLVYLALGAGYALLTPLWQAPDEPAHFNNIAHIAATGRLPVLRAGDYDQAYLEKLKAEHFPPELSIEPVRYEGHQPPLYYLLMTPVLWMLQDAGLAVQVWALRLLNVGVGALVILFIWLSARRLFPKRPRAALLAAGFVAFLPMHIAMSAAINNDALAELFIAAVMFRLLAALEEETSPGHWAVTGLLIGLGLLTKFQAYILIPLAGAVWLWQLWRGWRMHALSVGLWLSGGALALPALLLPLPWWLRNMSLYGPSDPFGLDRHNAVVVGQPRTLDWIAAHGWAGYLDRFITFTFRSFWGVFGWMGVFMDARVYLLLTLLSCLIVAGGLYQLWRWRRGQLRVSRFQMRGLGLLLLHLGLVAAAYLWYNLDFVQHQGRYFFPALLPISVFAAIGLLGLFSPGGSRWGAVAALVLLGFWLSVDAVSGDVNKWALLLAGGAAAILFGRARWSQGEAIWWGLATEGLMVLIALYALFGAILPQLQ